MLSKKAIIWLTLGFALLAAYIPQLIYQFPVPIGGDAYSHVQTAQKLRAGDVSGALHQYPPFFHVFPVLVAKLFHMSLLTSFAWVTPFLLLAAACSLGYFTWRWLRSWEAGLVAVALSSFVALQPFQIWQDGGFPNVLASYVFLPIGLWALLRLSLDPPDRKALGTFLAIGILIVITHHLTTLTFVSLCSAYVLSYMLAVRLRQESTSQYMSYALWAVVGIGILTLVALPLAFAGGLLHVVFTTGGNFPFIHFAGGLDNPNALLSLKDIPASLSFYLAIFGTIGLVRLWFDRDQAWQIKVFFSVWVGFLLLISQVPQFVFPVRFSRELGAPITILAAYLIVTTVQQLRHYTWQVAWSGIIVILFLTYGLMVRVEKILEIPEAVEFLQYDKQAAAYINDHALAGDCVVIVPRNRYYQYFLPHQTVIAYSLSHELRTALDAALDGQPAALPDCRYFVAERIPRTPDWSQRLHQLGFHALNHFDGPTRGVTVFSSGFGTNREE